MAGAVVRLTEQIRDPKHVGNMAISSRRAVLPLLIIQSDKLKQECQTPPFIAHLSCVTLFRKSMCFSFFFSLLTPQCLLLACFFFIYGNMAISSRRAVLPSMIIQSDKLKQECQTLHFIAHLSCFLYYVFLFLFITIC